MFSRTSSILIVSIMLIALVGVIDATADTEANKAIARRVVEEVMNQGNLDIVDELYATDYVGPLDTHGPEEVKQFFAMLIDAFPNLHYTVEDAIAEGDQVANRFTATGTHEGEFMGIPPTGKQVKYTAMMIHRFAEGKIVEAWGEADFLGLMQQLGAIPPTGNENYTWGEPSEVTGEPGEPGENKAIMHRVFEEILNPKNLGLVDQFYATDYIFHLPPNPEIRGLEGFKQFFTMYFTAFPDLHFTVEDIFAEGDMVVDRVTCTGTHEGELMGIPPTGKQVTFTAMTIHRIADGKVVEDWGSADVLGLMQQLTPTEAVYLCSLYVF